MVYEREECASTFLDDLAAHLQWGYVINTPTCFVMARPVLAEAPHPLILDPYVEFTCYNTWFIYCVAGNMSEMFQHIPFTLTWIAWEKRNKFKKYDYERTRQRLFTANRN